MDQRFMVCNACRAEFQVRVRTGSDAAERPKVKHCPFCGRGLADRHRTVEVTPGASWQGVPKVHEEGKTQWDS